MFRFPITAKESFQGERSLLTILVSILAIPVLLYGGWQFITRPSSRPISGTMAPQWGRAYMVCSKTTCGNWIWTDKVRSGTKRRKCGSWWPEPSHHNGKGKGYGKPSNRATSNQAWLESPPQLTKIRPLKKSKVQQEATDSLANSWTALSEET